MKRYFSLICFLAVAWYGYSQNNLQLMTYNVRNAKGLDEKRDIQRIANVILAAAPDVVAIQEVDSMSARNHCHLLKEIGVRTSMHASFAPSLKFSIGKYGLGVLSKEPPIRTKRVELPGKEEKRVMLLVEFEDYVYCSAHLSLTYDDRMQSLDIIRSYAEKVNKPFFVAGDFNDFPNSEFITNMSAEFNVLNDMTEFTFPASVPDRTLDYIVSWKHTEGTAAVTGSKVIDEPLASDHRPVVVTLRRAVSPDAILSSGPYLQGMTTDRVFISWVTNVSANSWVEYSINDATLQNQVQAYPLYDDGTIHGADVTTLSSGDTLYYRICSQETLSEGKTGHTAKSDIQTYLVP